MGGIVSTPRRGRGSKRIKYPARIVIVRHGQSRGNVDETEYSTVADWQVELTDRGKTQARASGETLRDIIGSSGKLFVYTSPYKRCKQTLAEVLAACGDVPHTTREEPRLREQDFGNFQDPAAMKECKKARNAFGRFFYRFPNGESGADVFDRVSTWLESLYKELEHGNTIDEQTTVLLCTHGLTGRLFLMRWFHWTVEEFEQTWNPPNAQLLVMERNPCSDPSPWARQRYQLTAASLQAIGCDGWVGKGGQTGNGHVSNGHSPPARDDTRFISKGSLTTHKAAATPTNAVAQTQSTADALTPTVVASDTSETVVTEITEMEITPEP